LQNTKRIRKIGKNEETRRILLKSFFFFWEVATSRILSSPPPTKHPPPHAATSSSSRFSKRWFSHYVNGKMCRISWPCEMEFLFFCDGAKNRFSGRGPLGLCRRLLCATDSLLSSVSVLHNPRIKLPRCHRRRLGQVISSLGFCCRIVGLL